MTENVLRIVRGDPTPEELAVLTALASAAPDGSDEQVPRQRRGTWSDPSTRLRRPLHQGPDAWRAAARPG